MQVANGLKLTLAVAVSLLMVAVWVGLAYINDVVILISFNFFGIKILMIIIIDTTENNKANNSIKQLAMIYL